MKTREFTINREDFEIEYGCALLEDSDTQYLFDELEIPLQHIKSFEIYNDYIDIKLSASAHYFNDDWYVNLQRVG